LSSTFKQNYQLDFKYNMYITSMNQLEAETGLLFDVVIEANLGNFTIPKKEDKT